MIASRYSLHGGEITVSHRLMLNPGETKYRLFRNWMCEKLLWLQKKSKMMGCELSSGSSAAESKRLKNTDGMAFRENWAELASGLDWNRLIGGQQELRTVS
jgi:hypothetical protein